MSVWTTKSSGRDRDFIVMRHTLRGVNHTINGIKFRNSYAVVEKGSKTHRELKRLPVLKAATEFPITFLRELPFITRPLDVKVVYGADVYVNYMRELTILMNKEAVEQKVQEETIHIVEHKKCSHRKVNSNGKISEDNELCTLDALEQSPSGYCLKHILSEPNLFELGIEVPKFIPKKDKQAMREKVAQQLKALKK